MTRPRLYRLAVLLALWAPPLALAQPPSSHAVEVEGATIAYDVVGEGPPLLLLHYFGGCAESWRPHIADLARHYRLILPDLRGHGRSTNAAGAFTHRQAARDVAAVLDDLGLESVRAVGLSSGGMTLLHLATERPDRVEAMVLVGATTHFPAQARAIMARATRDGLSDAEWAEWGACSTRGDAQTAEVVGQFYRMQDSHDDMAFTAPHLATITARTLVVHGDRDEFFPVDIAAEMYAAVPDAALWVVPGGGHLPVFGDDAEPFRQRALAFLGAEAAEARPALDPDRLALVNVEAEVVRYRGRRATRVTDAAPDGTGDARRLAVLPDLTLEDGTVELWVAGAPVPDAPPQARGFVGLAFGVDGAAERFEAVYLRPTNGRADAQALRNHATQYVAEPAWGWRRLRDEEPFRYEAYVDLEPGAWTHVRVEIDGEVVRLFVHGAEQPTLVVERKQVEAGALGLWVGPWTVAHFADVRVTPAAPDGS